MAVNKYRVGIRREDKNQWEARVPLTPQQVKGLIDKGSFEFTVQASEIRAFRNQEYEAVGAQIAEDLSHCDLVIGIKEMPVSIFTPEGKYLFFSHTIKGQPYNMGMLKTIMQRGSTLLDYERIVDEQNRRLIAFGPYAGLAGMIDSLWSLGQRLHAEGLTTPLEKIRQANRYASYEEAVGTIRSVGEEISRNGLPSECTPLVIGFAGYGKVSQGAQKVLLNLPVVEISPDQLLALKDGAANCIYKVVFKEEHTVTHLAGQPFELQHYYKNPSEYVGDFEKYLPKLSILMNCVYWEKRYPRIVTKDALARLYRSASPKLKVIGDISCDVNGSVECTSHCTDSGQPTYLYDTVTGEEHNALVGNGPLILAIDNLPAELASDSSREFGGILMNMLPEFTRADFTLPLADLDLPYHLKKAIIVYKGELTPDYMYLREHLKSN